MPINSDIKSISEKRDQAWLEQLFDNIWRQHFHDVERHNDISVVFGRRAKRRLGSISIDPKDHSRTIIRINGLFKETFIPEMLVKATLAHELCHYAHGFNSGGKQKHRHPHAGGVMRAEFAERGLEDLYLAQKEWLKQNWLRIVSENFPHTSRRRRQKTHYIRFFNT